MVQSEKQAFSTGRLLKRIWCDQIIDIRIWVRVKGADLRGADLRHADLRHANFRHADLWHANLRGTNLWYADLRGANLWYADLRNASRFSMDPAIPGWSMQNGRLVREGK